MVKSNDFESTPRQIVDSDPEASISHLHIVIDNLPAAAYLCDPSGLITRYNEQAVQLWGRKPTLNDPRDRYCGSFKLRSSEGKPIQHDACWMALALKEKRAYGGREIVVERPDGSHLTALAFAGPVHNDSGKIIGGINMLIDISAHKRTETALRNSEERMRQLMTLLPAAVYTCDADGHITYFNHRAAELWGREPKLGETDQRFCGSLRLRRIGGEPLPHDQTPMAITVKTGKPVRDEEVIVERPDGTSVIVNVNIDPLFDQSGRQTGAINVFQDISDRKRAEDGLRESEERARARAEELEAIMNSVPAIVWIARDPQCKTITGSRTAHELLRMAPDANLSKTAPQQQLTDHFKVLQDGRELSADELPVQVAATGVEVRDFEEDIIFDNGDKLSLYGNAVPLHDAAGNIRGAIGAFVDITQLKEYQEALKESDRRKDQFLAMLAHELRNPLAPIRNAVEIMRFHNSSEPQLQRVTEIIGRQVEHLTRLIDDLLDVSRITQGKISLRKEEVSLSVIVAQAVEASRPAIDSNRQELVITLPKQPVFLMCDLTRVVQVLENILSNAAKFTPEEGEIWLTAEAVNNDVLVKIRDTGAGIAKEHLPFIFDLFSQADFTLDRSQGGLGIGLTLVRSLVEIHDGEVHAFSEGPGKGSEFIVRLPAKAQPEAVAVAQAPDVVFEDDLPGHRILIVDDNVAFAESLSDLLQLYRHQVEIVHAGHEALALAATFQPHFVFIDIGLPVMDGYEVAHRMRSVVQSQAILVAITGYNQPERNGSPKEMDFDHYLVKPVNPDLLQKIINFPWPGA